MCGIISRIKDGVGQRWGNYLASKHGGNVKLRKLYEKEGDAYFEKNFTFTLLEYFGLSYDPGKDYKEGAVPEAVLGYHCTRVQ